ncbi:SinI family restriction endonuclease, partial [Aeromonas simiae]|uniref:SinI family restriction endonuclease n=2 Tax=Aeromonas simiae TaxID=218936 RepID=UPI00266C6257
VAVTRGWGSHDLLADLGNNAISCLIEDPSLAPNLRSPRLIIGSEGYILRLAQKFCTSRMLRAPSTPSTIPDEMVSVILNSYYSIPVHDLDMAQHLHMISMGAENIIGDLLERYIASVLEPRGWIWCSGSTVKAVDFIKPATNLSNVRLLQIKNRDNSENSSSSAIRLGTSIEKWHRTFSRTGCTNWNNFPDVEMSSLLNENDFILFVKDYLTRV